MGPQFSLLTLFAISAMLLTTGGPFGEPGSWTGLIAAQSSYTLRDPIRIEDNTDFTLANGVTAGSGSAADPYIIEGWEIDSSIVDGVDIRYTDSHFVLRDLFIHSGDNGTPVNNGILLLNADNATIQNVVSMRNGEGIHVADSAGVAVLNNEVSSNEWYGIRVLGSRARIEENIVTSNRREGIYVDRSSSRIDILNNVARMNQGGIWVARSVASIEGNTVSMNLGTGIYLRHPPSVHLRVTTITNNTITGNGAEGILSLGVQRVLIEGNAIQSSGSCGILVEAILGPNTVKSNSVTLNRAGICAFGSNFVIENNVVSSNDDEGITLGAEESTVTSNEISNNGRGIRIEGLPRSRAWKNSIFHNNLINNVVQASDDGSMNSWDKGYPNAGNYWSDYTGIDECSGLNQDRCPFPDGVGDTAYVIDFESQDTYPLMAPFQPVEIGNGGGLGVSPEFLTVLITAIVAVAAAMGIGIGIRRRRGRA